MDSSIRDSFHAITRSEIGGENDALIALFPSRKSGVEFLRENNAWGFVKMNREPEYAGIYIGEDIKKILYFGRISDIVSAEQASLAKPVGEYENFESGRKVIEFVQGELFELENSIPFESRVLYPPVRYTDLAEFKEAETMDDLL